MRKVAQHFFFVCETFTRINSSPSPRPSGSLNDDESSAGGLPADGESLAEGGPRGLESLAFAELDIFASNRHDLQVIWEWGAGSEKMASGNNTARGPPVPCRQKLSGALSFILLVFTLGLSHLLILVSAQLSASESSSFSSSSGSEPPPPSLVASNFPCPEFSGPHKNPFSTSFRM